MLQVKGDPTAPEREAAEKLAQIILRSWPHISDDPTNHIWIIVGAQCYGQKIKDIDLLLFASFEAGLPYRPESAFSQSSQRKLPDEVFVKNMCAAIEVKGHYPQDTRFEGSRVQVYYQDSGWKDATNQNYRQGIAVKRYIKDNGLKSPWVTNLLWLPNVPEKNLPQCLHNILGSDLTWEHFLDVMILNDEPHIIHQKSKSHPPLLASASSYDVIAKAADLFIKPLVPTKSVDHQGQEVERPHIRKVLRLRNAEEEEEKEEEEKIPLTNYLRLSEKEERLRKAKEAERLSKAEEERKPCLQLENQRRAEIARRYKEAERLSKAEEERKPYLQLESQRRVEIAGRYLANKQYKKALEVLSSAIQLTPNDSSLHSNMGYILIKLGRFYEALDASNTAIRLDPNNSHALVNQGAALNGLGRFQEALGFFSHAIQLTPNNGNIYRNIGYTLVRLEKFQEALDAFNHAIRFDLNDSPTFVNQGAALSGLGRYQEALEAYKRAEKIDPSNYKAKSEREKLERYMMHNIPFSESSVF